MPRRFDSSPFHLTNDEDIRLLGKAIAAVYFHDNATRDDQGFAMAAIERVLVEKADLFKRQFDDLSGAHKRLTGRPTPQSKKNNYIKRHLTDKPAILSETLRSIDAAELIAMAGASTPPQPTHRGGSDQAPRQQAAYGDADGSRVDEDIADIREGIDALVTAFGEHHRDIDELRTIIEKIEAAMKAERTRADGLQARIDTIEEANRPQPSAAVIKLRERIRENWILEHGRTPAAAIQIDAPGTDMLASVH